MARKQWIVCGSDDMFVRVYNYNTMDKVKSFEAHTDYIRSIAVHPTQPYLLTCSDDMLIKLWDWDKVCKQSYLLPTTTLLCSVLLSSALFSSCCCAVPLRPIAMCIFLSDAWYSTSYFSREGSAVSTLMSHEC